MKLNNNQLAFFALVKAGLWEQDVRLSLIDRIDFKEVYKLAEEQSVVGLVAAGLEHIVDVKPSKPDVIQFIGHAMKLEQQNQAMNLFIGVIVDKMRDAGVYTLLVKGQGVAQCYNRPLWRACGDIDFFLDSENYDRAKTFLLPLACSVEPEREYQMHLGMTIDAWVVELHGSLRIGMSSKVDRVIDETQNDVFQNGNVRWWMNGDTQVIMPGVDDDLFFIFIHFLKHFYKGGLGLRQICDWCRLLWTYRGAIDVSLLDKRLRKSGLMSEWKAFAAFAVEYLGLSVDAIPFYSQEKKWKRKAVRICSFILVVGNFGHNRDNSYFNKYPYVIRKAISFKRRCSDLVRHAFIIPWDSLRFFPSILLNGLRSAAKGE